MAASSKPVPKPIIVGLTGASGTILGFRLVEELLRLNQRVALVLTQKTLPVMFEELGLKLVGSDEERVAAILAFLNLPAEKAEMLSLYDNNHLGAPPASGTHLTQGMVIMPCSMGTLGKIANGIADNLVCRAADVTMKEHRKLILVPRETPFNQIHLKNMLALSQCGVHLIPPMLSFYQRDFHSIDGQINYTVGKVLDHLFADQGGFEHDLYTRWGAAESASRKEPV